MSKRCDAKFLQVLVRQARENRLVYVILAEDRLLLAEAQASQPDHDVHDGAPYSRFTGHHGPVGTMRPGSPTGWLDTLFELRP